MKRAVLFTLAIAAGPLFAHHGTGVSYDMTQQIAMKGTVTEFAWSNPHCQIYFDAKDDKGDVVHWAAETNSPGVLRQAGWTRRTLKPGDEITITVSPSKVSGTAVGVLRKLVLADGTVLTRQIGDQ